MLYSVTYTNIFKVKHFLIYEFAIKNTQSADVPVDLPRFARPRLGVALVSCASDRPFVIERQVCSQSTQTTSVSFTVIKTVVAIQWLIALKVQWK